MRWTCLLLLAVTVPAAHAQTVQKCVSRDGHARYQSEPCERGMRTAEVWDATPEPIAPPSRVPEGRSHATTRRGSAAGGRRSTHRQLASAGDACEQARAYREEGERRAGLSRNYELLSALQRRVFDACR